MDDKKIRERISELIEENPGMDTAHLVEVLGEGMTTRKVTMAINAIRKEEGLDRPGHIVSVKGRHYMPAALSSMGYRLQPNKKGTTLLAQAPKTNAETPDSKLAEFRAIIGDRKDHEAVLTLVWERYSTKLAADEEYKTMLVETRTNIAAATAAFRETIEEGRDNTSASAVNKLHAVEQAWQAAEERRMEAIEERKDALDKKKRAESSFLGLIENLNQLEMVFHDG